MHGAAGSRSDRRCSRQALSIVLTYVLISIISSGVLVYLRSCDSIGELRKPAVARAVDGDRAAGGILVLGTPHGGVDELSALLTDAMRLEWRVRPEALESSMGWLLTQRNSGLNDRLPIAPSPVPETRITRRTVSPTPAPHFPSPSRLPLEDQESVVARRRLQLELAADQGLPLLSQHSLSSCSATLDARSKYGDVRCPPPFSRRLASIEIVNEHLLQLFGATWSMPNAFRTEFREHLVDAVWTEMNATEIVRDLEQRAPFLIADHRLAFTAPKWRSLMSSEPVVVFVYRHPMEVVAEIMSAPNPLLPPRDPGSAIYVERALTLWHQYMVACLSVLSSSSRAIAVDFDYLVDHGESAVWELASLIATFTRTPLPAAGDRPPLVMPASLSPLRRPGAAANTYYSERAWALRRRVSLKYGGAYHDKPNFLRSLDQEWNVAEMLWNNLFEPYSPPAPEPSVEASPESEANPTNSRPVGLADVPRLSHAEHVLAPFLRQHVTTSNIPSPSLSPTPSKTAKPSRVRILPSARPLVATPVKVGADSLLAGQRAQFPK